MDHPRLMSTALDTTDARGLAEFYRELMGLHYRLGDEPPAQGPDPRGEDWLVLLDSAGRRVLAVQQVGELTPTTWPDPGVPMQAHQDWEVDSVAALERARDRALALGARLVLDRSEDPDEPLYVLADPAGHPFCLLTTAVAG